MKHLKQKWKPLALVVLALVATYGHSQIDTFGYAYRLFGPTDSNQDLITFNHDRPPQSQHVKTTTIAPALVDEVRSLGRDDVTPAGFTVATVVNKDSVKYFRSKDDRVQKSDQDAGASDQISTNRTSDQIAGRYPNISRAKHCQYYARNLAKTPAEFSRPDLNEKLTQASDLPQTLVSSSTVTISRTCGLQEWCELQDLLKFKFTLGVTFLEIPELKQKGLDSKQNALEFTLKPKYAANLRDHQATLDYLPESYIEPNKASEVPNAASGKTANTVAFYKICPALEEDKIANLKFHADYIHLDDPKVSCEMPQRCEKDSFADLLYSEQPQEVSLNAEYVINNLNATWIAGISEKIQDASLKKICKMMDNIVGPKWRKTAPIKQSQLIKNESLPVNFQGIETWPECANVREQSDCDSCWTHGTTKALNRRAYIKFEGALQNSLSVADITACCNNSTCFSSSCNSGQVAPPCDWFKKTSVVSNGPFGQDEFSYDQTMPLGARHVEPATLLLCVKVALFCCNFCPSNTTTEQASDKVKGISSYGVGPTVDAIKKELFSYDSVNAHVRVYEDILTHTSGVYQLLVNSWNNLWDDQSTFKILMGDCGINDLQHAGSIGTHSTATKNAQNNNPKVISNSKNLKTFEQPEDDVEIAPTSDLPAQAQTKACEDNTNPEYKTNACNPADQMCFNSQLVAAYILDLDKCSTLETNCFQNAVFSQRKTCQGDSACIKALKAVDSKIPQQSWDSATQLDARRTNYNHCRCYKAAVEDALTNLNQSDPFTHEVGPHVVSLVNYILSKKCGINDLNQLCGKIVFKNSLQDGSIQLCRQEHKKTHLKGRRLSSPAIPSGQCTGLTTNYNLLNTGVLASQSYGSLGYNSNANQACDGVIQLKNPTQQLFKRVVIREDPNIPNVSYWVATFLWSTNVQSILYIERQTTFKITFRVGDNPSYLLNPQCIGGQLTAGGWLDCSLSGKYLVLASTTGGFDIMEVMCYSQYFVHHKALSSILSSTATTTADYLCTTSSNCQASNVIRTTLVIWNNLPGPPSTPCCIYSQSQTDPTLQVTIPADLMVELVIITPSDQITSTILYNNQKNIEVSIVNSAGEKQICAPLSDYNLYTEVPCKKVGNQIIVMRPGSSMTLAMAGLSILSNCECSQSSLNPALISRAQSPLASPSTISTISTGAPISIKLNKQMYDTVSSVCGNAEGFTKCGPRTLVFTDKMTGFQITFPYKGYELNSDQSELTLNPAKATLTSVLTVTVKLDNYPQVTYQQDIIANVEQPAPVAVVAIATVPRIPNMALNATISQEAFLFLPQLDAQYTYVVVSKQNFEAQVNGNQLKVLSKNETDVGTYNLDLVANSSNNKVSLEVKVILALPTLSETKTSSSPVQDQAASNTTQVLSQARDSLKSDLLAQLQKVACNDEGECVDPKNNRFTCQQNQETGKVVCGLDLSLQKNNIGTASSVDKIQRPPVMIVSEVSIKGTLKLEFSERMNFSGLNNLTYSPTNSPDFNKYKYLLSLENLKISIVPTPNQNVTKLMYEWFASDITETSITIKFLFEHPTYISLSGFPNKLTVKLLPQFLLVKAWESKMNIINPLRTETRTVPPQLVLGAAADIVEGVSESCKIVAEGAVVSNYFFSAIMKAAFGAMYTMVHTFQMMMVFSFLVLPMPANVILVMTQVNTVASFDYLPSEKIMKFCFNFTKTVMPLVAFQQFQIMSLRLTLFLGTFLIAMFLICLQSLVFLVAWPFKTRFNLALRYITMMKTKYFWSGIIRLIIESYWDLCLAIMFSWQEPCFDNPSDIFDFFLTSFFTLVVIAGPLAFYILLRKNAKKLDNDQFQQNYGSLTDGYKTTGILGSASTVKMIAWFFLRRLLTALFVVYLGQSSPVIQTALVMYLAFLDLLMNFYLNALKSYLHDIMTKFNNVVVFLLSYFPFLYAGLNSDTELIYKIGWIQCSLVGIMFAINMTFMIFETIVIFKEERRRKQVEQYNLRMLQEYGFRISVSVQSVAQRILSILQIEWVYFYEIPRLNQQIAPYVELRRFELVWGKVGNNEQRAQIILAIDNFAYNQADIVAVQAEEFEMISIDRAENLVDQHDEFTFYEQQKAQEQQIFSDEEQRVSNRQASLLTKERIPISSEQSSREVQADKIVKKVAKNAQIYNKLELRRQLEETKSRPNQVASDDWEKELWEDNYQPRFANKNESQKNNAVHSTETPANQDAQEQARLKIKRKLIVEATIDEKKLLTKKKEQIVNLVIMDLQVIRDPIVRYQIVNDEARELAHLLPDDISHMSFKDQVAKVKFLISVCPEFTKNEKMEYLLQVKIKEKILEISDLRNFLEHNRNGVGRSLNEMSKAIHQDYAYEIGELLNQKEIELKKDQEEMRRLAVDMAYQKELLNRLSEF